MGEHSQLSVQDIEVHTHAYWLSRICSTVLLKWIIPGRITSFTVPEVVVS